MKFNFFFFFFKVNENTLDSKLVHLCYLHALTQRLDGSWEKHRWQAPEVWLRSHCAKSSDMFSFGLLIWYFVTEKDLYGGCAAFTQNMANIVAGGWRLPIPAFIPNEVAEIITNCWHMKPSERICIDEMVEKLHHLTTEDYSSFKVMDFDIEILRSNSPELK